MGRPTTLGDRGGGRANNFDALRFALAALVILSHSFPLLDGDNRREPFALATGAQVTGGELAVAGFFILSGFLIAQSWERSRSAFDYFRKRVARIYPGFVVAALFAALVVAPRLAPSAADYARDFPPARFAMAVLNLEELERSLPAGSFDLLPVPAVNGSLWSIRYEFCCYVGVALLGVIGLRRGVVAAAFGLALALHAGQIYFDLRIPGSGLSRVWCYPPFWPRVGSWFLAGMLAYLFRDRIPYSGWLAALAAAGLVAFALLPRLHALPLTLPLLGGYVLFWLAYLPTPRLHRFAAHGDFSYGVYLYAFPVQQLLVRHNADHLTPLTLFAAATAITLPLAVLSWYAVERPWLQRARHGLPDRPAAGP